MATFIDERFNSGANEQALSTANSSFSTVTNSGGSAAFTNVSPIEGSLDVLFKTDASAGNIIATTEIGSMGSRIFASLMGSFSALPAVATFPIGVLSGSGTVRGGVRIDINGAVTIRNGTTAVATSSATLSPNTLWRIDALFDNSNSVCEARIYIGSAAYTSVPTETIAGTFNAGTMDRAVFGITTSVANFSLRAARAYVSDSAHPTPLVGGSQAPIISLNLSPLRPVAFDAATLTAIASDDGGIVSYSFTQTAGSTVGLAGSGNTRTFVVPAPRPASGQQTLSFSVTATDSDNQTSAPAAISAQVPVHPEWWVNATGQLLPRNLQEVNSAPRTIGMIGDSLTYQGGTGNGIAAMQVRLADIGYTEARVDAKIGRFVWNTAEPNSTSDAVTNWNTAGFAPDELIIALGTNDIMASNSVYWRAAINNLLAAVQTDLPSVQKIYWANTAADPMGAQGMDGIVGGKGNSIADYNVALASELVGKDVVLLDWFTYATQNATLSNPANSPTVWANDAQHVHMAPLGYTMRNDWVAAQIN